MTAPDPAEDTVSDATFAAEDAGHPAPTGAGAATITPYRDGPLIVRGDFRLVDTDGVEIDPGRRTVALCRCGKSGIKPFCDGTHKRTGFSAASGPASPRPAARIPRSFDQPGPESTDPAAG
ncbi:Zn-finger domain of CDGSH type-containing protein [Modestobacter sp. DSM 44400]|uniref:CDGSH iron-sulfur domain-containing protein n=1 Tax=Modestobacter sp. DSM 44400 TaxID=1550230 RepID=UPI00089904C3|nr:CDGSH iron-sulfur domain-containing protein [Modestobacter sp. DSM 44400]SDY62543.1 Zn-finger domain of CDGSH type-containing protein [Modestobacter sp. DSM 44400]